MLILVGILSWKQHSSLTQRARALNEDEFELIKILHGTPFTEKICDSHGKPRAEPEKCLLSAT